MSLSHSQRAEVPEGEHIIPIGPARLARHGDDVTIVAIGAMVPVAMQAAATLAQEGIEAEVVDVRALRPWDPEMVVASVRKTGSLIVVHEAWVEGGFGAEIAATVAERAAKELVAPVVRVGAAPVPIPSGPLRKYALPDADAIVRAVWRVMSE
jgi:pyruvate/2-oxoglutarate/acetoin dehydrogenase E1 component